MKVIFAKSTIVLAGQALFAVTLALTVACSKNTGSTASGGGGGGGTVAASGFTPAPGCFRNGMCPNASYYSHPGFSPYMRDAYNRYYGFNNGFRNGLCGCPAGYVPTTRMGTNLGCIATTIIPVYTPVTYWSWNPAGLSWVTGYLVTGYPTTVAANQRCTFNAIPNCQPGMDHIHCGPRGRCIPINPRMGICN
jgi:hypothetical protein